MMHNLCTQKLLMQCTTHPLAWSPCISLLKVATTIQTCQAYVNISILHILILFRAAGAHHGDDVVDALSRWVEQDRGMEDYGYK